MLSQVSWRAGGSLSQQRLRLRCGQAVVDIARPLTHVYPSVRVQDPRLFPWRVRRRRHVSGQDMTIWWASRAVSSCLRCSGALPSTRQVRDNIKEHNVIFQLLDNLKLLEASDYTGRQRGWHIAMKHAVTIATLTLGVRGDRTWRGQYISTALRLETW